MWNVGVNHHKLCMIHSPVLPLLIEVTFFLSILFFAKRQNLIFLELIFARLNCISKFMSNTMKVVTVPIEILEQND